MLDRTYNIRAGLCGWANTHAVTIQSTVDVSSTLELFTTNDVPAVTVPTRRSPVVPPATRRVRKIRDPAATVDAATVTVPATNVADPVANRCPDGV